MGGESLTATAFRSDDTAARFLAPDARSRTATPFTYLPISDISDEIHGTGNEMANKERNSDAKNGTSAFRKVLARLRHGLAAEIGRASDPLMS